MKKLFKDFIIFLYNKMTLFNTNKKYKDLFSKEERIAESNRIIAKYPDYIPVIIDCSDKIGKLRKQKFLVPSEVSASHLLHSVRKQFETKKSDAIFMFCDNMLICPTTMMKVLYTDYKIKNKITDGGESDKFLYIEMNLESVFGYEF
jgi:GABA(A) receptor-associated protein